MQKNRRSWLVFLFVAVSVIVTTIAVRYKTSTRGRAATFSTITSQSIFPPKTKTAPYTTTLPIGVVGVSYSAPVYAYDSDTADAITISALDSPPGLVLKCDGNSTPNPFCTIGGVPTVSGFYSVRLIASDSAGLQRTTDHALLIKPTTPPVTPTPTKIPPPDTACSTVAKQLRSVAPLRIASEGVYYNWGGLGDKWFIDKNNTWYYIIPSTPVLDPPNDSIVRRWDGHLQKGGGDPTKDTLAASEHAACYNAISLSNPPNPTDCPKLTSAVPSKFFINNDLFFNWGNLQEKWFIDQTNKWYYIYPTMTALSSVHTQPSDDATYDVYQWKQGLKKGGKNTNDDPLITDVEAKACYDAIKPGFTFPSEK